MIIFAPSLINIYMKRTLSLFLLLLLASCASAPIVPTPQLPTAAVATATLIRYEPTFTIPTPSPTSTPVVCDPFRTDFCITDGNFIFRRPIKAPDNTFIDPTYAYASTANGTRDPHHGVEFLNAFGTPVYAAGDGVVLFAGVDAEAVYSPWPNYYGNVVVLKHADDLYTVYAHLSKIDVETGQAVSTGDLLGEVGQSGVAVGPHLHFEVRRGNVGDYFATQNPELWLFPNKERGVVQISIQEESGRLIKYVEYVLEYLSATEKKDEKTFFGITYSADMQRGDENAVMGDLNPGKYRIAFKYNGQLYEQHIEVESGKLTQVVFVVK